MRLRLRTVVAFPVAVLVLVLGAESFGQSSSLDQFKKSDASYDLLQIQLQQYKGLPMNREDWCALAKAYDSSVVSLQRAMDQRRFLCGTKWCPVSQSDLPQFKALQDANSIEMRNAERRCR